MMHNVRVLLKTRNIWEVEGRVQEVNDIREWLDAQVNWATDQYEIKYIPSQYAIDIWFKDERYATMCRLRWLA